MKIWQRGALLILVPVICDGIGLGLLDGALRDTQRLVEKERQQILLLESIDKIMSNFSQASICIARSLAVDSQSEKYRTQGEKNLQSARESLTFMKQSKLLDARVIELLDNMERGAFAKLEKMLNTAGEDAELVSTVVMFKEMVPSLKYASQANKMCLEILQVQKNQHNVALHRQNESQKHVYQLIYGLIGFNIVWILVALYIFHTSITQRLRLLMENAKHLSELEAFQRRLSGSDEFVELDGALSGALSKLTEAREFRANVVSMVVHDLRSPLTSLGISLDFLKRHPQANLSELTERKVESMGISVERLIDLINGFLDVEKMQSGQLPLTFEVVEAGPLVSEVIDSLEDLAGFKRVELVKDCPDLQLNVDRQKTLQVLTNLVSNAIKFTANDTKVIVRVRVQEDMARFEIQDNGPGLTPEAQGNLFRKFGQGATPSAFKGTGLGLFITKWLIEAQGGALGVESSPGSGSTFWFTLAIAK